jgi:ferrous iron transport protein B
MSHCEVESSSPIASAGTLTVALAGNPNSGKTTLFNALTGLRQKVANYPGVTVEKKTGRCTLPGGRVISVIDLPGTYSLISRSPDETVAMEVLRGLRPDTPAPDAVIVVVDASNLQRNLYLVSQLIELGRPMVVALNMMDIADRRGHPISPEGLSKALGVPVIPVVGHRGRGVEQLKAAIAKAVVAPLPDFPLPQPMKDELLTVGGGLAILDSKDEAKKFSDLPSKAAGGPTRSWICQGPDDTRRLDRYQALAERLLIGDRAPDIAPLANRDPVPQLLSTATTRLASLGIDPMQADIEAHYRWIETVATAAHAPASPSSIRNPQSEVRNLDYAPKRTLTERVDHYLLHRVWGLLFFAVVMATLFVSIFWLASPMMDAVRNFATWFGGLLTPHLPDGPIRALWADGIVAGVGAVVVFVPQIALLFLFLSLLEDSGYLARAAFLMDRLLSKVGLSGKSFIPLLSSFACAIPGIMATRTIESRKDRLATILVAPFMSCSARLPVYFLLIGTFFSKYSPLVQGGLMLGLYLLGILAAVATAWVFKRTFLKGAPTSFILELPTYKPPQVTQVARVVTRNTLEFLTKAGTTIFCLSVILWAMTYYPRLPGQQSTAIENAWRPTRDVLAHVMFPEPSLPRLGSTEAGIDVHDGVISVIRDGGNTVQFSEASGQVIKGQLNPDEVARLKEYRDADIAKQVASAQLRHSLAGRFGHILEPALRPVGYDWKMGVGLVGAFAAREVFVSTMAITYSAGSEDDTADLSTAMRADTYPDGSKVWTPAVALSLLVWFVLAMQCMSTLAIVRRETGGWGWPMFMVGYMNVLAYAAAFVTFHVATRILA